MRSVRYVVLSRFTRRLKLFSPLTNAAHYNKKITPSPFHISTVRHNGDKFMKKQRLQMRAMLSDGLDIRDFYHLRIGLPCSRVGGRIMAVCIVNLCDTYLHLL